MSFLAGWQSGYAAACKAVYAGSIPASASKIIMKKEWRDKEGNLHTGKVLAEKDGFSVIDCELCEFSHVIEIPDDEFLEEYYKNQYLGKRVSDEFYKKMESEFEWNEIFHNEKFDIIEPELPTQSRKVLDIGSGLGCFLSTGKKRGWQCKGIEPSVDSANYAREKFNLDISEVYLSSETFQDFDTYDFIHSHEVFEHLRKPLEMLEIMHKLLNKDGVICIVCPNDFNPLQKIANSFVGFENWWVAPPEHLNYFSMQSLKNLISKASFEVIYTTSTFPLELFILQGENYIGNDSIGSNIHKKRMELEKTFSEHGEDELRRKIYHSFSNLGLGREIAVFARKIS